MWNLEIDEQLEGGAVSVVIGAVQHAHPVVLKIHPPWILPADLMCHRTSVETEAAAFAMWGGRGAPRLLAHDTQALLLERVVPAQHSPEMSASEVATLIGKIAAPLDIKKALQSGIPILDYEIQKRYRRAYDQKPDHISGRLLATACSFSAYLGHAAPFIYNSDGYSQTWELVHGDLKVKNILQSPDGEFRVIDPSPAIGTRLYDAALWATDKPENMLERCEEIADCMNVHPQAVGSLAVTLAISEICLASSARADATFEYIKDLAGTGDLDRYFTQKFLQDNFMDRL